MRLVWWLSLQEMEQVTRVQTLEVAVYVSLHANENRQNSSVLLGGLGSLVLVRQLIYKKENSKFKPALLCLKTDLVSYPAHGGGVG